MTDTSLYGTWELANLADVADEFGPIYSGGSVQQALELCLRTWLPTYIAGINRKMQRTVLRDPKHWEIEADYRPASGEVECDVMVHVPGTQGAPEQLKSGTWVTWRAEVACHLWGTKSWRETEHIAYAYGAAVRGCIAQHRSLVTFSNGQPFATQTKWMGDQYRKVDFTDRAEALLVASYHVVIGNALLVDGGPSQPSQAPSAPPPTAQSVVISTENIPPPGFVS